MSFKTTRLALAVAASILTVAAGAAQASPIFDGSYYTSVGAGDSVDPQNPYAVITNHTSNAPVTYDLSASSLDVGARPTSVLSFANLQFESSMDPLPHVSAFAQTTGEYQSGGYASLRYDIRAFDTNSADAATITSIPLIIEGHWSTSVLGYGAADAALGLSGGTNPVFDQYCLVTQYESSTSGCGSQDFAYRFSLDTPAFGGIAYEGFVNLSVSAFTYVSDPIDGQINTVQALLDPIVYIDPAFLALHPGVTLFPDGSGGIFDTAPPGAHGLGGAGGVPEPASWALMIAGFGLTGAALRRRRAALA